MVTSVGRRGGGGGGGEGDVNTDEDEDISGNWTFVGGTTTTFDGSTANIDATELDGSGGTDGQVLTSDGTNTAWESSGGSGDVSSGDNETITGDWTFDTGTTTTFDGSTTGVSHGNLSNVGENDHHSKDHDHSEGDISTIPNTGLTNTSVTVAGNAVSLGGTTNVDYVDLNDTGASFPIPNTDLNNSSLSVAGNSVSLGGSTNVDYIDLNDTGATFPIPNTDLNNSSVTVAGNSVDLGGSTNIDHADISNTNSDDHHTKTTDLDDMSDVTNVESIERNTSANKPAAGTQNRIFLESDTGKVLYDNGTSWVDLGLSEDQIDLGNLNSKTHDELTSVGENDHHSKDHDHSEGDISTVPNSGLTNNSVTVAGNSVSLGGSTNVDYIDLNDTGASFPIPNTDLNNDSVTVAGNSVSLGNSTTVDYVDLNDTGATFPIPNTDLNNSSVTVAGNSVDLGGTTDIDHADISNTSSDDHHTRFSDSGTDNISDIPNRDATDLDGSSGTADQVLTTDGTTNGITWSDSSGGTQADADETITGNWTFDPGLTSNGTIDLQSNIIDNVSVLVAGTTTAANRRIDV